MNKASKGLSALLALGVATTASAAIYKCVDAEGESEFRNVPCDAGDEQEVMPERQPNIVPSVLGKPAENAGRDPGEITGPGSGWQERAWSGAQDALRAVQELMARLNLSGAHVVLLAYLLMSPVSFFTYRKDKRASQKPNARRVPEATMHWQALLGGWPGALAGQQVFRHKTVKPDYQFVFWIIVALHVLLWIDWARGFPVLGGVFEALR